MHHRSLAGIVLLGLWLGLSSARAETASADHEAEIRTALAAVAKVARLGPSDAALLDQATLKLPEGYAFVPRPEADQLMRAMGNRVGDNFVGLVLPTADAAWFAAIQYEKSGYIRDDEAKAWNVNDLLRNLKEGTAAANDERRARGMPELEILGWIEPPHYDATAHRLVWSLSARQRGDPDVAVRTVNYNTYALGREGFISLNLITDSNTVEADKAHAHTLLNALQYQAGKSYADFNESTDRVAAYGLAALVGGVAAKKLGLLAVIAAFAAKFWKLMLVAVIGVGAAARRFMRRKQPEPGSAP